VEEVKGGPVDPLSMESLTEEALEFDEARRGQLREGIILEVRNEGLVVDIGVKRDGFVPREDFKHLGNVDYNPGDTVPVMVVKPHGTDGNVELSVSQAKMQEDWLEAERLKNDEGVYESEVLEANRGGLTVQFGRLRGFVPMSQLIGFTRIRQATERHRRLRAMVGQTILLKVIEVNRRRKRLILSQQAAAKEWRTARRQDLLEELSEGQVRTGRLSQITDFGLFVNLGGLDGLVHVSELSWGRIDRPEDTFRIGQRLKVKVLSVDRDRQRIALSIKALTPDPWESAPDRYDEGDLAQGKVTQITDFGIFIEIEPGVEGLLHNTELLAAEQRDEIEIGDKLLVKIIRIEPDRRRIGLSARQVQIEEWERWAAEQAALEEARAAAAAEAAELSAVDDEDDDDAPLGLVEADDEDVVADASETVVTDDDAEDVVEDVSETVVADDDAEDVVEDVSETVVTDDDVEVVVEDASEEAPVDAAAEVIVADNEADAVAVV